MIFLLAAFFAIVNSTRERRFTWTHALVIFVASVIAIAAGVDGAYPR